MENNKLKEQNDVGKRAAGSKTSSTKTQKAVARNTAKKRTTAKAGTTTKTAKARATAKAKTSQKRGKEPADTGIPMSNEVTLVASFGLAVLFMFSNFGLCGMVGKGISFFFFGIFGCVQYIMPLAFFVAIAVLIANDYSALSMKKTVAGFTALMMLDAFVQVLYQGKDITISDLFTIAIEDHWTGGIIGGGIGLALKNGFGSAGAMVIIFCIMLLCLILLTQHSFIEFLDIVLKKIKSAAAVQKERSQLAKSKKLKEKMEESYIDLDEDEESGSTAHSAMKMRTGRKKKSFLSERIRTKQCEDKVRELEEQKNTAKTKKAQGNKQEAMEAEQKKGNIKVNVPVFTSSDEVKRKDAVKELHPKVYPFSPEEGKVEPFESTLDFTAFSFNSGKTPEEFADEMEEHSKASSFVPPYKSKGGFVTSELKTEETDAVNRIGLTNLMEEDTDSYEADQNETNQNETDQNEMNQLEDDIFERTEAVGEEAIVDVTDLESDGLPEMIISKDLQERFFENIEKDREEQGLGPIETAGEEQGLDPVEAAQSTEDHLDETNIQIHSENYHEQENQKAASQTQSGPSAVSQTQSGNNAADKAPMQKSVAKQSVPREGQVQAKEQVCKKDYLFPPMSLLAHEKQEVSPDFDRTLKETAIKLQQTLESFGVRVTITDISCGPAVTRYEMFPEQGTKVSKILSLTDDIKLNLAAADIRIEAPIPGKAAIGIEVPNKHNLTVHFRDLVDNRVFRNFKSKLAFAVGKDIGGKTVVADLGKMPHLLIAGATGSGKSVCINTLIMSILYKATPEEVKLIMIDPKMVELSTYNGIPHLLIPVVTDPKKASGALNWAVAEMTDRYKKFTESKVRNIEGYNKKMDELIATGEVDETKMKKMPKIVIIIDELADLMMVSPGEVEDAIVRLSQLARAAGIHLVIATQRPSVNVITGLIKANVPSRIAFSVSSGVDSRTIIDMNGAEKLLGKGDMLFYPSGYQKPIRVQGAFVSDNEVGDVVEFLKENEEVTDYDDGITEKIENKLKSNAMSKERDEYFEAAARFIMEKDKATIGMLQRMFKVGFNRAARIIDQLSEAGIVGPEEGTKPRKILMSPEQLEQYFEEYL